ncbi:MAG: DUF2568 domain-containing protein, partial [Acidimicrobiales bacterium]
MKIPAAATAVATAVLTVRFLVELAAYASLASAGAATPTPPAARAALAVVFPLGMMAVWSRWLAPR